MAAPKPLIPFTALHAEYLGLLKKRQELRLRDAERLDVPQLTKQFSDTVAGLAGFEARGPDERWLPFYPSERTSLSERTDTGTTRIARRLENSEGTLHTTSDAQVRFRYVDREIVPLRRPGATFGPGPVQGKTSRAAPRLDLLVQAEDGTPVVGEVKVAQDKDPFFGLIQALMHTAHLASPHQVERLGAVKLSCQFKPDPQPPFDVYLILQDFDPEHGRYRPRLYERAQELAAGIVEASPLQEWIRQIACLDVSLAADGVAFECLWRAGRSR
jgi:hypothetical protein